MKKIINFSTTSSVHNEEKNSKFNQAHSVDDTVIQDKDKDKSVSFAQDLKPLMYGFGDIENPENESLELLEQYIIEYVQNISISAYKKSKNRGFSEIKLRDLILTIKNDKKKYYRVPPLLSFYEGLKKQSQKTKFT